MTAAVEARALSKRYGPLTAVDGLGFVLERGEVMGVLGPNGAGKTTAVRVLTTILEPDAGSFSIAGIPHSRPAEIRRRIGVLPESGGYPERQTGEEYLRYHARLYGRPRAAARAAARALLDEVGLRERAATLIAGYSRGMRQRLGIARALLNEPEVVFLDEPTLGLDPAGQRQVLEHVRAIARERGAGVVLSTHLLPEVEECCSRVLILDRGRAIAHGSVEEVVRLAGAARRARLRVPARQAVQAAEALAADAVVARVDAGEGPEGTLVVAFAGGAGGPAQLAEAVGCLLRAGVDLLACELEGARLGDAFLAITGARDA